MLVRTVALISFVATSAGSNAQTITFHRTYKVGDTDVFAITLDQTGAATTSMTMTETLKVTKLLDDGGAEVNVSMADMKMTLNGKETVLPPAAAASIHMDELYNKEGFPYQVKGAGSNLMGGAAMLTSEIFAKGLTVGQAVPFEYALKAPKDAHTKGTITLTDVTGSTCHLHMLSDTTDASGGATSHADIIYTVDTSTGKATNVDMHIHLDARGGSDMHMVMKLQST